ncbi:MAG: twin-arginine translocase TatA/TatE family subunit [Pirellulales bacterium]|nr:twin-arginine translocase TatA/TatE family subunit [Pirellulales bacterium]
MSSLFGWAPGPMELVIVAFVVLLLFGNRLPSVMRNMGRGLVEFKKGMQGTEDEPRIEGDKRGEAP